MTQDFAWQSSTNWGIETASGQAAARLSTLITITDSYSTGATTLSGTTKLVINGTGSPCNYEITRTENGAAQGSGPLDVTLGEPLNGHLVLQMVDVPDLIGTTTWDELSRNYGGNSCSTTDDQRAYPFGTNSTYLEAFYHDMEYQFAHSTLDLPVVVTPATDPNSVPIAIGIGTSSLTGPLSRGMGGIEAPVGQQTVRSSGDWVATHFPLPRHRNHRRRRRVLRRSAPPAIRMGLVPRVL